MTVGRSWRRRPPAPDVVDVLPVQALMPAADLVQLARTASSYDDVDAGVLVRAFVTPRAAQRATRRAATRRPVRMPRRLPRLEP